MCTERERLLKCERSLSLEWECLGTQTTPSLPLKLRRRIGESVTSLTTFLTFLTTFFQSFLSVRVLVCLAIRHPYIEYSPSLPDLVFLLFYILPESAGAWLTFPEFFSLSSSTVFITHSFSQCIRLRMFCSSTRSIARK